LRYGDGTPVRFHRAAGRTTLDLGRASDIPAEPIDVTAEIRTREITTASSRVSAHPGVRRNMVERQRRLGEGGGVVLEGRDIGTAVFPDAEAKFYLDADPERRARRRQAELRAAGSDVALEELEREIRSRDAADSTRADSPLIRAHDATLLDTTELAPAEVVERMAALVESRREQEA
jgi:cytidylate kinase